MFPFVVQDTFIPFSACPAIIFQQYYNTRFSCIINKVLHDFSCILHIVITRYFMHYNINKRTENKMKKIQPQKLTAAVHYPHERNKIEFNDTFMLNH